MFALQLVPPLNTVKFTFDLWPRREGLPVPQPWFDVSIATWDSPGIQSNRIISMKGETLFWNMSGF